MKTKILFALTLIMSLSLTAQIDRTIQPKPGPAPKVSLNTPKEFKLKNGLKVLVVKNNKLPKVSYNLTIDIKPIFEGDKAGVTSLLGSMMGNGTSTIAKDEFNEEIEFYGAYLRFGFGSAYASSLTKYSERMLELMADATMNPLLTESEFQKEKDIYLENLKSQEKDVSAIAGRVGSALSYGKNHPFGEFSSKETINNITLNDIEAYHKKYFNPNNAYLIIIGDVDYKTIKKQVKKYFENWKKTTDLNTEIQKPKENVKVTEIDFIDAPNAVQSNISLTNNVSLKVSDEDYHAVLIANKILGGGFNSYLNMNLREEHAYTYGAGSSVGASRYTSRFKAGASVRNEVTDSAVVQILKEINKIKTIPVAPEKLKNAKAKYTGDYVLAMESPKTVARYALNIKLNELPKDFYETYLEKINAVTVEDVQRVANKYFKPENARIIIVGKGEEILSNLEKTEIPIHYYDKFANPIEKPDYSNNVPKGVTAKTVLQKYLDTIKFSNEIQSLKIVYEGASEMGTFTMQENKTKERFSQIISINKTPVLTLVFTPEKTYINQGGNKTPLPEEMEQYLKETKGVLYEASLLNNTNAKLTGIEEIEGMETYRIEAEFGAVSIISFYAINSGVKVKESFIISRNGQSEENNTYFSNYKEINGTVFPEMKKIEMGGTLLNLKLREVIVNPELKDKDFQ